MGSNQSKLQNNKNVGSSTLKNKTSVKLQQLENGSYVGGVSLKYLKQLIEKITFPKKDPTTVSCPNQHLLSIFTPDEIHFCDICKETQIVGCTLYSCQPCNFDMCETCMNQRLAPTMTDLVQQVIKPRTHTKKESYLELLAREQPDKVKPTADYFVSYVWSYKVVDELLASLKYTLLDKTNNEDVFIWLDAFCVNQHMKSTATPEQLQQTFGESLKAIGSVVMVLVNWKNPEYSKRMWCVFEAFITKSTEGTQIILAMSEKEEKSLVKAMIGNEVNQKFLNQLFSSVDVESAKAKEPADEQAILQIIRKFGVSDVNTVILGNLKQWMVQGGEIALKSVDENSREAGSICVARRAIHDALGEYDVALEWAEKALNIDFKVYGPEHQDIASDYNNIAASLQILGRLDEALVANEQASTIYIKVLGVDHLDTINSREWKAGILETQGKLEEALVIYSEVLESRKRVLGEDHISTVMAMSNKAGCLLYLKRHDEALPLYNQAITISKRTLGENHPNLAQYLNNKAVCLKEMGRPEEALPIYDQIMGIKTKVYGADHPEVGISLMNKAACLDSLKRYNEALVLYDQSLTIRLKTYGNEHADVGRVLHFKAVCLKHLGREKEAMEIGKQALGICERTLGHDHPYTVIYRGWWGN
jgi:tetratricopeptide (TPR) repeat protein